MVKVAREHPEVHFLAFTKQFEIVNTYMNKGYRIPKNLRIIFSYWDKSFEVDNPHNRPKAYIEFNDSSKNLELPKNAKLCSGSCDTCKYCWMMKNNETVYFHEH